MGQCNPARNKNSATGVCECIGGLFASVLEIALKTRVSLDYGSRPLLQVGLHLLGGRACRLFQCNLIHYASSSGWFSGSAASALASNSPCSSEKKSNGVDAGGVFVCAGSGMTFATLAKVRSPLSS
jgi:hypothetical protein